MRNHSDIHGKVDILNSSDLINVILIKEEIINRIDIMSFCEHFGIDNARVNGNEIRAKCPVHKGDNPNNFRIKFADSSGSPVFNWTCYSSGCEKEHGNDIFGLVRSIENCSLENSARMLMEFTGMDEKEYKTGRTNLLEERISKNELSRICNELAKFNNLEIDTSGYKSPFLNEDFVERSLKRRNLYFKSRGFSDKVLDVFEVGHCSPPDSAWSYAGCKSRAVIPIRDEKFRLVGISGRAEKEIPQDSSDSKYRILTGSDKAGTLYGLCYSRPYIEEKRSVIIVEGFCDMWKCWMAGIKNVVAIMGKSITEKQMMKLVKYSHRALLCFDYDDGKNKENAYEMAKLLSPYLTTEVAFIDDKKDLGASTIEEVQVFFNKYMKYI
jgi:DNA primase